MKRCCLLCFVLTLLPAASIHGQDCAEILRYGLFDTQTVSSEAQAAETFANWFETNFKRGTMAGKEADIGYAGFGARGSESSVEEIAKTVASFRSGSKLATSKLASFSRTASPVIAKAWEKCVSQPGFHASAMTTYDPNQFYLIFRYSPFNFDPSATLFWIKPSSGLTCESIPENGIEVSVSRYPVSCKRDGNIAVSVSFYTDTVTMGDPVFEWPAIQPRGTAALEPCGYGGAVFSLGEGARLGGAARIQVAVRDGVRCGAKAVRFQWDCNWSTGPSWMDLGLGESEESGSGDSHFSLLLDLSGARDGRGNAISSGARCQVRAVVEYENGRRPVNSAEFTVN